MGLSITAVLSCTDSSLHLNSSAAMTAKQVLRNIFVFVVGIVLPLYVYLRSDAGGSRKPHTLRWLATVWTISICVSFVAPAVSAVQPVVAVLHTTATASAVAPLVCALQLSRGGTLAYQRLKRLQLLMASFQHHLDVWKHKADTAKQHISSFRGATSMAQAAIDGATAAALAEQTLLVDEKQPMSAEDLVRRHIQPIRHLLQYKQEEQALDPASALGKWFPGGLHPGPLPHSAIEAAFKEVRKLTGHTSDESSGPLTKDALQANLAPAATNACNEHPLEAAKANAANAAPSCWSWRRALAPHRDSRLLRVCYMVGGVLVAVAGSFASWKVSPDEGLPLHEHALRSESPAQLFALAAFYFCSLLSVVRLLSTWWDVQFFRSARRRLQLFHTEMTRSQWCPYETFFDAYLVTLLTCQDSGMAGRIVSSSSEVAFAEASLPYWVPSMVYSAYCYHTLGREMQATQALTPMESKFISGSYVFTLFGAPVFAMVLSAATFAQSPLWVEIGRGFIRTIYSSLGWIALYMILRAAYHQHQQGRVRRSRQVTGTKVSLKVQSSVLTRAPAFVATLDSQLVTIVALLGVTALGEAASTSIVFCFLHLTTLYARGTIHNNNIAFSTAALNDRVEQYAQFALHRTLQATLRLAAVPSVCSEMREACNALHVKCESILLDLVQQSRSEMYYTPLTVRVIMDSLLQQLAAAWEREGLQIVLDRRRVDFDAAHMQELQVHPRAFLISVCEAVNRVATDVLMFKQDQDAPVVCITPFLRKTGLPSCPAALRVAVSQRLRGITADDMREFGDTHSLLHSSQRRWGPFLAGASRLQRSRGEGAWLAGTRGVLTADYSEIGGVYTISVDTPITWACHKHSSSVVAAAARALRMHASVPQHDVCICQLLAPAELNIGEADLPTGMVRIGLNQTAGRSAPCALNPCSVVCGSCCSALSRQQRAHSTVHKVSPQTKSVDYETAHSTNTTASISKAALSSVSAMHSTVFGYTTTSGSTAAAVQLSKANSRGASEDTEVTGSQLFTLRALPPALQKLTSLEEQSNTSAGGATSSEKPTSHSVMTPLHGTAPSNSPQHSRSNIHDAKPLNETVVSCASAMTSSPELTAQPTVYLNDEGLPRDDSDTLYSSHARSGSERYTSHSSQSHVTSTEGAVSWTMGPNADLVLLPQRSSGGRISLPRGGSTSEWVAGFSRNSSAFSDDSVAGL